MLREYLILLPVKRDSNGKEHADIVWQWFENCLLNRCGGFTRCGNVSGTWKDDDGNRVDDVSRSYTVAASRENADESYLRRLCQLACVQFDQQCIYLRLPSGDVELVSVD